MLRLIAFTGIAHHDEREVALFQASGRDIENTWRGDARGAASIMASRHSSTRLSAIFCQAAVAQFSLLKYQLKPQIGFTAISTAVTGNPARIVCRTAPLNVLFSKSRATLRRSRCSAHSRTARSLQR